MEALYAGMRALLARRDADLAAGAEPVGWKVGFNAPSAQEKLGLDAPVAGYLTGATVVEPGGTVSLAGAVKPALEPEIAITVGEDQTVAALGPALEIVDFDLPLEDLEAILGGNVFHRAVVFGPVSDRTTVEGVSVRLLRNGEEAAAARDVYDPEAIVEHVAAFLTAHGAELQPGDRIIGGALAAPPPVSAGDRFELDLGPLGTVSVRFG